MARPSADWRVEHGGKRSTLSADSAVEQRLEQRLLAGKVVVERAFADADGAGDVAQAGAEVALVGEQRERGVENGLAGALSVGVGWTCHKKLMVVHLFEKCKPGAGTRHRASGVRDQGSGIRDRDQGSGIRDQGSGIRDQGSGISLRIAVAPPVERRSLHRDDFVGVGQHFRPPTASRYNQRRNRGPYRVSHDISRLLRGAQDRSEPRLAEQASQGGHEVWRRVERMIAMQRRVLGVERFVSSLISSSWVASSASSGW